MTKAPPGPPLPLCPGFGIAGFQEPGQRSSTPAKKDGQYVEPDFGKCTGCEQLPLDPVFHCEPVQHGCGGRALEHLSQERSRQ
jgi:hypothetical protein